ncbi:MAG: dUTP diphosphatase [Candidatus Omnitrophica bacterium]|nr:dUTP diphosphatase [Candidatus Omnitrophota bacterium]
MNHIDLKIKKVKKGAAVEIPQYMSDGASGLDLCVSLENDIILAPFERALIPTGLSVSIPRGFEAQIRPRSGLAIKYGITLLNSPGTIDSDYRGEINLVVINLGSEPFVVKDKMRMAQMVISQQVNVNPVIVDELDETVRGAGGFGHTGM